MTRLIALLVVSMFTLASALAQSPDRSQRPAVGPTPVLSLPEVERHALSNGIDVLFMRSDDVPLVQMNVIVRAGRVDDPADMPGLASLTAAMLDRGAGGKSALELSDAFEFLGARFSVAVDEHFTQLSLRAPAARFSDAVSLLADVLLRPHFEEPEIDRLRAQRLTSLIRRHDEPLAVAHQLFGDAVLGADHPYARVSVGSDEFLRTVSRQALADFHSRAYAPENTSIVMSGAIDDGILATVNAAFSGWALSGAVADVSIPEPPQSGELRILLVDNPGAAQSVVRIGHTGVTRNVEDFYAIEVMNTILGGSFTSRLNQNLREDKGYTYGASSSFDFLPTTGRFSAGASVFTAVTAPSISEFMSELRAIAEPMPQEEVDRARSFLAMRYPQNFQSVARMASMLTDLVIFDLEPSYLNEYPSRILDVSNEAIADAARRHIRPDNMTIVIVGDRATIESELAALDLAPIEVLSVSDVLGPVPTASR
jgi:zinc protease